MALAAQIFGEVDQIALAIDDARTALQGPQIGAEVEFGSMDGDTARPRAFQRISDKIEPMLQPGEMFKGTSGPTKTNPTTAAGTEFMSTCWNDALR